MSSFYVINENGELYQQAYSKYSDAVAAVKMKHKTYLEEQIREVAYLEDIESVLKDINVPENTSTGISLLYIEKGINIIIQKMTVS